MTPRFARTLRFANVHAMFAVDLLGVILWLSAFATQAAYNTSGLCGNRCSISKGVVAIGVIITYVSPSRLDSQANALINPEAFFSAAAPLSAVTP